MADPSLVAVQGSGRRTGDAPLDPRYGVIPTISREHAKIHEGDMWEVFGQKDDVGIDETINFHFATGDDEVHLKSLDYWANASKAFGEIIEAPSAITPGTPLTPMNRNRAHPLAIPGDLGIYADSTGITGGTVIEAGYFGGAAAVGQKGSGDAGQRDSEFVFAPNTDYVICLTNLEANDRDFSLIAIFYLHRES